MEFRQMFQTATGEEPFPYQRRFAEQAEPPETLAIPTGAGKTACAILGWLWRRRFATGSSARVVPRRLVFCLPMRTLVEQTERSLRTWLKNLQLDGDILVSVLMGGEDDGDWDLFPEKDSILIGTQDMLMSRALNRGYGMSRYRWPLPFAWLNNDVFWVFDEIQLMGSGLATAAQMAAFREKFKTFGATGCLWMSATLQTAWLSTVDFKERVPALATLTLNDEDRRHARLSRLFHAMKPVGRLLNDPGDPRTIAHAVMEAHRPGSLTLVIFNTIERASAVHHAVLDLTVPPARRGKRKAERPEAPTATQPETLLLHSRFRPPDRSRLVRQLESEVPASGRIAITTQVVEAGMDISARTLVTELAPWPSLVQRFGRCNRRGEYDDARVLWIDLSTSGNSDSSPPYRAQELDAARSELSALPDVALASLERHTATLDSAALRALFPFEPHHVLRRKDIVGLFDTTPDLAGNDIDVSRFIRDNADLDVFVFWREVPESGPPPRESAPRKEELCLVAVGALREAFKGGGRKLYRWDALRRRWDRAALPSIAPGQLLLAPAESGGYSPDRGWDPKSKDPVAPWTVPAGPPPDANERDPDSTGDWQTIAEHTNEVVAFLDTLLSALGSLHLPADILRTAARFHDRGKAHAVFQEALSLGAERIPGSWAKAPVDFQRYRRPGFRHELASALAMLQQGIPDLACYLAAAHHGKVRLSIRSLPTEKPPVDGEKRFARGIWEADSLPETDLGGGEAAPPVALSLRPMELGLSAEGRPSWAELALRLIDPETGFGPFRLAVLEALLRVADIRVSARHSARRRSTEVFHE